MWGQVTSEGVEVIGCLVDVALWAWRDGLFPDAALEHEPLNRCLWVRRASYGPHETSRFGSDRCLQFAFREILTHVRQHDSTGRQIKKGYANIKVRRPPGDWKVQVNKRNRAAKVAKSLLGAQIPDGRPLFSSTMLDDRRREVVREFLKQNRDLLRTNEIQSALHPTCTAQHTLLGDVFAVAGRFTA
jgi:hypothetical protein